MLIWRSRVMMLEFQSEFSDTKNPNVALFSLQNMKIQNNVDLERRNRVDISKNKSRNPLSPSPTYDLAASYCAMTANSSLIAK